MDSDDPFLVYNYCIMCNGDTCLAKTYLRYKFTFDFIHFSQILYPPVLVFSNFLINTV